MDTAFFSEDVESIELFFLRPTGNLSVPFEFLDYSGNTVKAAVGITAPAALQTTWTPASTAVTASVTTIVAGGVGSNEVQRLTFTGREPAFGSVSFTLPARSVAVSAVEAGVFTASQHGLLNGQAVALSAFAISGGTFSNSNVFITQRTADTFRIASVASGTFIPAQVTSGGGFATLQAITTPSTSQITAESLQQLFVAAGLQVLGIAQIVIGGSLPQGFEITFANSQSNINFDLLIVSSSLSAAPALQANLSFNTTEVAALIAAGAARNLRFEVEVFDGSRRQTYTSAAAISSDIIKSTTPSPIPSGAAVSFDLLSPNSSVFTITIDNDGTLTAAKQ